MRSGKMRTWSKTFKRAFCERTGCQEREFRRRLFRRSLYGHARPVVPLIRLFRPAYFALDYELIDLAGEAHSWKELSDAIEAFSCSNKLRGGPLRRAFRIRVSCRKLGRIARRLMSSRSAAAS